MKKAISLFLVLCMLFCIAIPAFAADDKTLKFNENGKFKILVFNDIQDDEDVDVRSLELIKASIESELPDLVILNGDQISDINFEIGYSSYTKTIRSICDVIQATGTPFLFTYGNHDADKSLAFPLSQQSKVYRSYSMCYAANNGPDTGTYNNIVMSSDGSKMALNIYMMNTGAWDLEGWLSGVTPSQIRWYKNTCKSLKAENGGEVVPAIVFQHIPVKETYDLLKEVDPRTEGAIRGNFFGTAYKGYVLDEARLLTPASGPQDAVFKSAICSEHPLKYTGQYSAWVEMGDVFGAFFAHDHKNNFVAMSDDGIAMGYNRGAGFATEGDGDKRGGRVFVFDENNIEDFDFYNVTYAKLFPDDEFEDTEGGIGFIANNLLQTIRAKIADTFFWMFYPGASFC